MSVESFLLIVFLIFLIIYSLKRTIIRIYKLYKLDAPSMRENNFLLGIVPTLLGNSQEERFKLLQRYSNTYTGITKVWAGPVCIVNVNEPKLVQQILTSDKCWAKARIIYDQIPFGDGLFTVADFEHWKANRRAFSYTFARKNLLDFVQTFVDCADELIADLSGNLGKTISFYDFIFKCSLKLHLKTLFKVQDYEKFVKDGLCEELLKAYEHIDNGMAIKLKYPIIYPSTVYKLTQTSRLEEKSKKLGYSVFRQFVQQHKKYLEDKYLFNNPEQPLDFLKKESFVDQIVYYEKQLTPKQADDHMLAMMSPHRTLGLQITQAVLMMAMHPDVQDKVYNEIQQVYHSSENVEPYYESVQKLEYMDRVIKETMRLFPSIPFILRNAREDIELDGHLIPEGVDIFVGIYSVHHNKDAWGERADYFDPDNFLPERISKIHPSAFIPFSLGKRNCIGKQFTNLSMKIILKKLIETYKFTTPMKYEEIELINDMTLKMANKPLMMVEKR